MNQEVEILMAEDDPGHAGLIRKNLSRAGIGNTIRHFSDGQQLLDFLFRQGDGPHRESKKPYLLLLDIRMPKVSGVDALERIKGHQELRKLPVIMLTTTDDPKEVEHCHTLGCSTYITKPIEYGRFVETIKQLGMFLMVVQVPQLNGSD